MTFFPGHPASLALPKDQQPGKN